MNVDKTFFLKCTTSRLSFRRFRWDTVRHILIRNIQRLIVSLERPGNSQLQLNYWQNTFDKFLFLVNTVHFSLQFGKLAILFRPRDLLSSFQQYMYVNIRYSCKFLLLLINPHYAVWSELTVQWHTDLIVGDCCICGSFN